MKIKVGVLFGGKTTEHEVSIITAVQAMGFLNKEKYEVIPMYGHLPRGVGHRLPPGGQLPGHRGWVRESVGGDPEDHRGHRGCHEEITPSSKNIKSVLQKD